MDRTTRRADCHGQEGGDVVTNEQQITDPQPAPTQDVNATPIWPLIIAELVQDIEDCRGVLESTERRETLKLMVADMEARHAFGVAKYGVPLVASNERDHLADAYQEMLDGIAYLRAEIERCGGLHRAVTTMWLSTVERTYHKLGEQALALRGVIEERRQQKVIAP